MTSTLRTPASAPGRLPVLGHGLQMKRRPAEFLLELQSGEPVVTIALGKRPAYVVNDPTLMRELLRDGDTFVRGGPMTDRFRSMFGNGLGISEGEFHRRQRALIQPAFHRNKVIHYTELMSRTVAGKLDSWRDGQRLAVEKEMDELALSNVVEVVFAGDRRLDRARFMAATTTVLGGLFRRITDVTGVLTRLPTQANRDYDAAAEYLRATIRRVIAEYRAAGTDHGDLLSMMLFARDEDGRPAMSDEQVHDEVMTFFIAGSNTIANTLCWALHHVGADAGVQRRLHAEVDRVLDGRAAGYADVAALEYTRQVLSETLRLRTQGLFNNRVTARDAELGGYLIPAGSDVLYSFHAVHHNPRIYPEPERFDPDRWLPERARALPRGAFMPFATGVHGCIGDQFAWTEMIVSLASIAARWRLEPVPGHEPKPVPAMTMPVDALPMTARLRTR
ncbi:MULTISPECIES: cytochrome P450 [unclassified Micromonospora]|uniref:cytochrome P450 n=1 Tax=unclassified Micromonospora TaxID=2617518 RepID=UPI001B368162|nr:MULTISPECIES: cytochrome P450 [unclassified Micromonospora]MBQ1044340.1 cytochrome P450 [Micromonospora sp. C72]MBQ1056844.1 cytochrome P450 [Micromonospora sp. C32]